MRDLHQAAQGMTATQLTEEMAHALLFGEIDTRREQGDDFMKYYYVPGEYYVHIDYQHKMKNELAKVRKQAKENIQVGDTSVLINLNEKLKVAEENVYLKHLRGWAGSGCRQPERCDCFGVFLQQGVATGAGERGIHANRLWPMCVLGRTNGMGHARFENG